MVQAVHGHHGLKNAGEKKVTNVVVIRNARARHSVNCPRSSGSGRTWFRLYTDTKAWENAGEKKVTNVVVVLFRTHIVQAVHGHHGLRNAGEKEGYKCRRCLPMLKRSPKRC
jgi:hypothetical protein